VGRLRHPAFLLILALCTPGCLSSADRAGLSVTDAEDFKAKGRPVFGAPIALPRSHQIIVPFAVEHDDDGKYSAGFSSGSIVVGSSVSAGGSGVESGYVSSDNLRWNNVVFLDSTKPRLLLDIPAVITRFHTRSDKGAVRGDYILLAVAARDTNGDRLINDDDAVVLSRASTDGRDKTPLTAADDQIVDIHWIDGWTYLRVRKDSDGDKRFSARDHVDLYRVQLDQPAKQYTPELVLDDKLRQQAFDIVLRAARQPRQIE
jgi:hypothetical protein